MRQLDSPLVSLAAACPGSHFRHPATVALCLLLPCSLLLTHARSPRLIWTAGHLAPGGGPPPEPAWSHLDCSSPGDYVDPARSRAESLSVGGRIGAAAGRAGRHGQHLGSLRIPLGFFLFRVRRRRLGFLSLGRRDGSAAGSSALVAWSSFAAIFAPAFAAGAGAGAPPDALSVAAWPSELASGTSPPPHPVTMKHAPAIPRRANQVVQGFMGPRSFQNFPYWELPQLDPRLMQMGDADIRSLRLVDVRIHHIHDYDGGVRSVEEGERRNQPCFELAAAKIANHFIICSSSMCLTPCSRSSRRLSCWFAVFPTFAERRRSWSRLHAPPTTDHPAGR